MKFTRPWYGVLLRLVTLPLALVLILLEHVGDCANEALQYIDEVLP